MNTRLYCVSKRIKEIKTYTVDLVENQEIQVKYQKLPFEELFQIKIDFQSFQSSFNKTKKIHRLIRRCLEVITTDNFVLSSLTGKILKQKFNSQNSYNLKRSTSLLEQSIKQDAYLEGSLRLEQDISTFFLILFQDQEC
ncbi:unnamed protein product [Paramecium octaurelia]|uniref:Uncharacterized protein n=1 Tax=Paramecium octaurelia TaxID=43137 RepID=A0A8S1YFM2_PAROT|nr:unnamed protein product [Paramecium octaurelia]